jgi:hypothetical protein
MPDYRGPADPPTPRLEPTARLEPATALRSPTVVMDGLRCGAYHVAAASQAGVSHLHHGTPRQDAYDFVVTPAGRLVVAIAGGLGSRKSSQLGARLFGEQVVLLALDYPDWTADVLLGEAADNVGAIAESRYGVSAREAGFVAAVAVFDAGRCTIARVGDVTAFAAVDRTPFRELYAEPAGPLTAVHESLPGCSEPEVVVTDSRRVVLATHGLAGDLRLSPSVRRWLAERWSTPVTAHAMGESLRFRRPGSHDDRTAVVVWYRAWV